MPRIPSTAITVNQTLMTGPNIRPTMPVPSRWTRNRTTMIATVMGMTRPATDGAATSTPSTAESTEMAGVIMLSPKNSEAPKMPSAASTALARAPPGRARRRIRAISAMIPPSPSLSARITSKTYVMVTMIVTDQKISEMTPKMLACVTVTGCGSLGLNTVWTVYSGLVPMSPKTTPRAPTARAHWAVVRLLVLTAFLSPARTLPTRTTEHHTVQTVARRRSSPRSASSSSTSPSPRCGGPCLGGATVAVRFGEQSRLQRPGGWRSTAPPGLLVWVGGALPPVPGQRDEAANHVRGQPRGAGNVPQRRVFILGGPGVRRRHARLAACQYPPARTRGPAQPVLGHTESAGGNPLAVLELAQRSLGHPGHLGKGPPVPHAELDPACDDVVGEPPPVLTGHMTVLPPSRRQLRDHPYPKKIENSSSSARR